MNEWKLYLQYNKPSYWDFERSPLIYRFFRVFVYCNQYLQVEINWFLFNVSIVFLFCCSCLVCHYGLCSRFRCLVMGWCQFEMEFSMIYRNAVFAFHQAFHIDVYDCKGCNGEHERDTDSLTQTTLGKGIHSFRVFRYVDIDSLCEHALFRSNKTNKSNKMHRWLVGATNRFLCENCGNAFALFLLNICGRRRRRSNWKLTKTGTIGMYFPVLSFQVRPQTWKIGNWIVLCIIYRVSCGVQFVVSKYFAEMSFSNPKTHSHSKSILFLQLSTVSEIAQYCTHFERIIIIRHDGTFFYSPETSYYSFRLSAHLCLSLEKTKKKPLKDAESIAFVCGVCRHRVRDRAMD